MPKPPSSPPPSSPAPALKVLFLSSDTGGGHRASAVALGEQFKRLFPNSTYHLLDITKECSRPYSPYNNLQSWYSHLSSNPKQWNLVYKVSNNKMLSSVFKIHFQMSTTETKLRQVIQEYEADVVISVHPLMNDIPLQSCMKISNETNRHLPFFTVVTDLNTAHSTWFHKDVEKMFIASTAIEKLARRRGRVPKDKLIMMGLPIRYDFALEANMLNVKTNNTKNNDDDDEQGNRSGRYSLQGKMYQLQKRKLLNLTFFNYHNDYDNHDNNDDNNYDDHDDRKIILVMGGGEGVGSLSNIVHELFIQCSIQNIRSTILVVCGRNTTLKESLEACHWDTFLQQETNIDNMQQQKNKKNCQPDALLRQAKQHVIEQDKSMNMKSLQQQEQQLHVHTQPVSDGESIAKRVTGMVMSPFKALALSSISTPTSTSKPQNKNESIHIHGTHGENDEEKKETDHPFPSTSTSFSTMSFFHSPIKATTTITTTTQSSSLTTSTSSLTSTTKSSSTSANTTPTTTPPLVIVKPLGFVTNMAEYMVASDLLLTKAGPGTIAEAASLSLPILLTSYLPGQEEGNVDFVIEKKFGEYYNDSNPKQIASIVCQWLQNPTKMKEMSIHAHKAGMPNAAENIVKCIGKSVLRWKELHEEQEQEQE